MTPEARISKKFRLAIEKHGGYAIKVNAVNFNGFPDRIVLLNGLIFLVELKSARGVVSKLQKLFIKRALKININVFVVASEEEIHNFVEYALAQCNKKLLNEKTK